ncbi:hypothetical protein Rhe02_63390 [Rhizocola hellebori]|uniref:HEAT repeat domain-containing protein n=1 Tax=Rhizocola hellebori TaxID=1392758 RepID=A0A8J3QES8_9ACTN|nr:HEAT repeat domain-containing protein [Rhizocola hellebori]GIH08272.1 hypothetical protein Rhe02_63390 [Rhizocola hellebori]
MAVDDLISQLSGRGEKARLEAIKDLKQVGEPAVAPLVASLLDEQSPVSWSDAGVILRGIGRPAFWPVVEAIAVAASPETLRRCAWAFAGFGAEVIDLYARALSHEHPRVREEAALGVQYCKEAGLPALPDLLPLLAAPDDEVRQRAVWAMAALGEDVLPLLQQVRRSGPGHLRPGALRAIAEVAGEQAFSDSDRAAVERLIRIKLTREAAEPIEGCGTCGSWLALPTSDHRAICEALDLSTPRPATMTLGFAAFYCDGHGMADDNQRMGRVFLTPRLDGWTLVMGPWYAYADADWAETVRACRELSERFGQAQCYWHDAQTGSGSWVICQGGELIRAYDQDDRHNEAGPRLPVEQGKTLSFEEDDEDDVEGTYCDALMVAAAMSVSPDSIGAQTQVHGHGLLALTKFGRQYGVPNGTLPI